LYNPAKHPQTYLVSLKNQETGIMQKCGRESLGKSTGSDNHPDYLKKRIPLFILEF